VRTLIRPTGFVDSPFGHDGKVARLAGGLSWFASVELLKLDEQLAEVIRLDANAGIADLDAQRFRIQRVGGDLHIAPLIREFQGIRQQVVEHLHEFLPIQPHFATPQDELAPDDDPFAFRERGEHRADLVDRFSDLERFGIELHAPRLHF